LDAARLVVGRLILWAAVPGVEEATIELPGVDARALVAGPGPRWLAEARITAAATGVVGIEALGADVRASDAVARRRERGAGVRRVLKRGGVEAARLATRPLAALAVAGVATVRRRAFDRRAAPGQWRAGCPSAAGPRAAADAAAATPAAASTAGAVRASVSVADAAGLATAGCRQGEHARDQEKERAHAAKRSTCPCAAPLVSSSPEEGGGREAATAACRPRAARPEPDAYLCHDRSMTARRPGRHGLAARTRGNAPATAAPFLARLQ
jgi:hypothetical protein